MIKLATLLRNLILEGGNVFDNTSSIKREHIEPTLEKFVDELQRIFPEKASTFVKFETLGSAGKKDISGDIDLSYDSKNLVKDGKPDFKGWKINEKDFNDLVDSIKKRSKVATDESIHLRAMIELISDNINNLSKVIKSSKKSAINAALFCLFPQYDESGDQLDSSVQIDINFGNPDWLKFSYYSKTYTGNVKGLHRTQLLVALFANKNKLFKHQVGVIDKETRNIESSTPKETLELLNKLYNTKITEDIINDYPALINYLRKSISEKEFNKILDIYLKILDSTRADIPEDLQSYWIKNQERLDLKGKFLPDDSSLIKYQKL
jgi:hypothetical protein